MSKMISLSGKINWPGWDRILTLGSSPLIVPFSHLHLVIPYFDYIFENIARLYVHQIENEYRINLPQPYQKQSFQISRHGKYPGLFHLHHPFKTSIL